MNVSPGSRAATIPLATSTCLARLLASNSTGKLTSWNSTVSENSTMAATIKPMPIPVDDRDDRIRPAMKMIIDRFPPTDASGTIPFRSLSGA